MSSFVKIVGAIALLIAGAVGLLMSLCGGVFTLSNLARQGMPGVLMISVPSLVVGLAVTWVVVRKLRQRLRRPPDS